MTAKEKLKDLFDIRNKLHPLTAVFVVGVFTLAKDELSAAEIELIEAIYPHYFPAKKESL